MRKLVIATMAFVVMFALAASAFAVGPGKTLEYQKGGKVIFDGKVHSAMKCNECHPALFKMKKGSAEMTMKDMEAGKYCGACHNGTKAFAIKECDKCHKK